MKQDHSQFTNMAMGKCNISEGMLKPMQCVDDIIKFQQGEKVVDDIHDFSPVCTKSNTTGATSGAGTACPSGSPDFSPVYLVGFMLVDLYLSV